MNKTIFDHKIVSCRFINETNTVIEILYEDSNGDIFAGHLNVDAEDHNFQKLLELGWDLEKISKSTIEYNRKHNKAFNDIINNYVKIGVEEKKKELEERYRRVIEDDAQSRPINRNALLKYIITNNTDEELLFKLKLAVFDMDEVKEIRDKSMKMKIRKAQSMLSVFSLLQEMLDKWNMSVGQTGTKESAK
jgi:hypothetical protein